MRAALGHQADGEFVGIGTFSAADADLVGQPPQVLDEHDAQGDRHGPELADGQRLGALIGADEAAQDVRIEIAVGMRDERPGNAEHPRIAGERPVGEFRQLAVVTGRQVVANLADLFFDEVIVVQQPFGGGHHFQTILQP